MTTGASGSTPVRRHSRPTTCSVVQRGSDLSSSATTSSSVVTTDPNYDTSPQCFWLQLAVTGDLYSGDSVAAPVTCQWNRTPIHTSKMDQPSDERGCNVAATASALITRAMPDAIRATLSPAWNAP